jgi:hypothetical protein
MTSAGKRIFGGLIGIGLAIQFACGPEAGRGVSAREKQQIADSLRKLVVNTYDLSAPNVVDRMMSLYPTSGPVYSTSSGHITTTRDSLRAEIETFWKYVGNNMQNPRWEWTAMHIDVLAPDAAVMTATYRVPHMTPMNMQHVIAGGWTAVFVNRGGHWVVTHEHLSDVPAEIADSAARRQMMKMTH